MLEDKDYQVIKEKACYEIKKIRQLMESQTEIPKADWEQLCLALKVYEKLLNVESMEQTGYSGYRGRDNMGRYTSRDYGGTYSYGYGNSYDNHVIEDMMRRATPQERDILMRMMR